MPVPGQSKSLRIPTGKVGALRSAKMGVFQITPLYSKEISDYGINDTLLAG